GDFIAIVLVALGLILGIPAVIATNLFSRMRQLRADVDHLQDRLRRIETLGSSRLQAGGPLPEAGGPLPEAEKQQAPAEKIIPPREDALPPRVGALPPRVGALPPEGGSF